MRIHSACTIAEIWNRRSLLDDNENIQPRKKGLFYRIASRTDGLEALYPSKALCRHKEGVADRGPIYDNLCSSE